METLLRLREDEAAKLREDNQSMFADLQELVHHEESLKSELLDIKSKRQDVDQQVEDLREKSQN